MVGLSVTLFGVCVSLETKFVTEFPGAELFLSLDC